MSRQFSDNQLAAFLDGTLGDEATMTAIEAAINDDPAMAERMERFGQGDAAARAVRDAFAPLLETSVPEHLVRIVKPAARTKVADPAGALHRLPAPANDTGPGWRWPQFAAMAASLVLGVMIGGPLLDSGSAGEPASLVLASADVTAMLATAPSGQSYDLASLGTGEVMLTFRNTDKQVCRQFMVKDKGGTTSDALACTDGADGRWQIEAYGRRAAPLGEMKLAGGDAAPSVVAAVDAMIDSDPLLGPDEAAALRRR